MQKLYHGLAWVRGFREATAKFAVFLRLRHLAATLSPMRLVSARAIVVALLAALVVFGAAAPSHARSYGKLDAFVVRQKIRREVPKINRCYESALRGEPELAGKVKVQFAIVLNGDVRGVRILENTTGHAGVERCVTRVVSEIQFPSRRSGKALSFTFPFVFAPQR